MYVKNWRNGLMNKKVFIIVLLLLFFYAFQFSTVFLLQENIITKNEQTSLLFLSTFFIATVCIICSGLIKNKKYIFLKYLLYIPVIIISISNIVYFLSLLI